MQEYDIKFKKFDKKRTVEAQLSDLINDLKSIGVKIIDNSRYQNGYGEGVCLILTQLLDKYLINQNFVFSKPKLIENKIEEIQNDFEEVILEESNNNSGSCIQNNSDKTRENFRNTPNSSKFQRYSASKRYSALSNTTQGIYIYI